MTHYRGHGSVRREPISLEVYCEEICSASNASTGSHLSNTSSCKIAVAWEMAVQSILCLGEPASIRGSIEDGAAPASTYPEADESACARARGPLAPAPGCCRGCSRLSGEQECSRRRPFCRDLVRSARVDFSDLPCGGFDGGKRKPAECAGALGDLHFCRPAKPF